MPETAAADSRGRASSRVAGSLLLLLIALVGRAPAATLILTSEPTGAQVFLNDQYTNVTPCTIPLPDTSVGAVNVRLTLEGYVPVVLDVSVSPQREYALKATLMPLGTSGPSHGDSGGLGEASGSRVQAVTRVIEEALRRFQADCLAFPATLEDLTVASADLLSARVNPAGERIRGATYRGPYLDVIPPDPGTGAADWHYDSARGTVLSRLSASPVARLEGWQPLSAQTVGIEEWLDCFQRATGVRAGTAVDGGGPTPAGPSSPATSPAAPGWRPL